MKINFKKVAGSVGAVVLGLGGLIAAGKAGFCENLGKSSGEEPNETPDNAPAAEPAKVETETETAPDNGGETT